VAILVSFGAASPPTLASPVETLRFAAHPMIEGVACPPKRDVRVPPSSEGWCARQVSNLRPPV
jgi:hypothetical protein